MERLKKTLQSSSFFYIFLFFGLEFLIRMDFISKALIPSPLQILKLFIFEHELFLEPFAKTALFSLVAFLLSSVVAFLLAVLLHHAPSFRKSILPMTLFFQTVPIVAIAPLLVIYLGFGAPTVLSAALIVCFFPVFAATLVGLQQVSKNQVELFQFLKARPMQKLLFLEVPSALPTLTAGLKTAAGLSVVGVVSGEFVAGGGLGALIDSARLQQRVDLVFAALILLSVIGLCLMGAIENFFKLLFKRYLVKV